METKLAGTRPLSRTSIAMFIVCALAASGPAFATLGRDVSTVQQDRTHLKASLRVSPSQGYTVHELTMGTGTTIREYAAPDGRVFAVAWTGPWKPDLQQLLGDYFTDYQVAAKAKRTGRNGPLSSRVVIEAGGRPRAFFGRAFVPDLVPSNVNPREIQ
jgi:Protein of unknown function (DUF2844)